MLTRTGRIAMLIAAVVASRPGIPQAPTAWGYGELKLGMTLEEADALRADDRIEKCDPKGTSTCLVRDDVAFGRKAKIMAKFDDTTHRVSSITIEIKDFNRRQGHPCQGVADTVIKAFTEKYGEPKCTMRRIGCEWQLPDAVKINTGIFCPTSDPSSGGIDVVFSQSPEQK